jgi:hypothetical protein
VKIDLSHVLHWPPQPTTMAGVAIIGVGLFLAPEVVWPALVTGLIAIIGDDGTRPKNEEAESGATNTPPKTSREQATRRRPRSIGG